MSGAEQPTSLRSSPRGPGSLVDMPRVAAETQVRVAQFGATQGATPNGWFVWLWSQVWTSLALIFVGIILCQAWNVPAVVRAANLWAHANYLPLATMVSGGLIVWALLGQAQRAALAIR